MRDWERYMTVRNLAENIAKSASAIAVLGPHEVGQHRIDKEAEYIEVYFPMLAKSLGYKVEKDNG